MPKGLTICAAFGQFAAMAAVHEFSVAIRDTATLIAAGVTDVNLWDG